MSRRRIWGLVALILGVALIFYALHSMKRIADAKEDVGTFTKFLPHNAVGKYADKKLHDKVSQYDTPVRIMLIGGIILVIVGGGFFLFSKKKK